MNTCFITLCLLVAIPNAVGDERQPDRQHPEIAQALSKAESDSIERVVVFYIPERILAIEAITDKSIEKLSWGSVDLRNFQRSRLRNLLLAELRGSSFEAKKDLSQDFRWACVFYDARGSRLLSLYLTARDAGQVNGTSVLTDGRFLAFLQGEFSWLTKQW